jgi:hypothetical protein
MLRSSQVGVGVSEIVIAGNAIVPGGTKHGISTCIPLDYLT